MTKKKESPDIKGKDWSKISEDEDTKDTDVNEEGEVGGEGGLKLEYPDYQELERKLTETEQKLDKYRNEYLRAQAEIDNIKRRAARDIENAHKYSIEKFALELLPIVDSLEKSLENIEESKSPDVKKIAQGLELTMKMFLDVLKKFGIEQINPLGEPFNPAYHQAMTTVETDETEPNQVLKVLQKGYLLYGRLARPALVVVSKVSKSG